MKPASLFGIALELIESVSRPGSFPADARVGRFFRERRFLGSHDRRFVSGATYSWLRGFPCAQARWESYAGRRSLPDRASAESISERLALLLDMLALAAEGSFPWSATATLEAIEEVKWEEKSERPFVQTLLDKLRGSHVEFSDADWPTDPEAKRAAEMALPKWLATRLATRHGEERSRELAAALAKPATVDLRVNTRLSTRESVRKSLEKELECTVEFTPWSPVGLRIHERRNLTATTVSRRGWIEVADEGSQVIACALDTSTGMTIIDACAGAGGKTLALADKLLTPAGSSDPLQVWSQTQLIACDIAEHKLQELKRRANDAGVEEGLTTVAVEPTGALPSTLEPADIVLVDAPCSGFGTLRRNPDLKLRYNGSHIEQFATEQLTILQRFAPLVKPGGRLAYATCSLLTTENEAVATAFMQANENFTPYSSEWATKRLPPECWRDNYVRLDPLLTQTDAFFLAQWTRNGD